MKTVNNIKPSTYLFCLILVIFSLNRAAAATFTVTNTNDSGEGSLRWAIIQTNSNSGPDTIRFNILTCGDSPCTISPNTALPYLTDGGTTIDGYTQPGSSLATCNSRAVLMIEIEGSLLPAEVLNVGLGLASAGNVIKGLTINRFPSNGIAIATSSATGNFIQGNHIGTNNTGSIDLGNGLSGIFIGQGAHDNIIGYYCSSPPCEEAPGCFHSERNVISGNEWEGVSIHGDLTDNNKIYQNFIGTRAGGDQPLGNTLYGVRIYGGAKNNIVADKNIISGNIEDGVRLAGAGTTGNLVEGNYIGISKSGLLDVGNGAYGVNIMAGARENTIALNTISGNDDCGVSLCGTGTNANTVSGNIIGSNVYSMDLGNTDDGVYICEGAQDNLIGGDSSAERNVISSNGRGGIYMEGEFTEGNTISGNFIGTNVSGNAALGNGYDGIIVYGDCQNTIIGGSSPEEKNVIAGNGANGITLRNPDVAHNTVRGNYIGTNAAGTAIIPNIANGIDVGNGAHDNMFGPGNIIAGSGEYGIEIMGNDANNNIISGNFIGTNSSSTLDLGNSLSGVYIWGGDILDNTVGPGNVIAYNKDCGVVVNEDRSLGHRITRNSIFSNLGEGIDLRNGANNAILPPEIISNATNNYVVEGTTCSGCTVEIFSSENTDGEGKMYLGSGSADGAGFFRIRVSSLSYPYLTATATDADNNTSEFSEVFIAEMPFPWPMFLPAITHND